MTRETKLGLAVALAFLALVGGVLGVKLMQGDAPTAGDGSLPIAEGKAPEAPQPTTSASAPPPPPPAQPTASQPATTAVASGTTAPAAPTEEPKPFSPIKPDPDAETIKITGGTTTTAAPGPDPVTPPPTAPPPVALPETAPAVQTPAPPPGPDATATPPKPADPFAEPPPPGPPPGPVPPLETPKPAPEVHNEKPKPAPIILPSGGGVGDAAPSTPASAAAPITAPPPAVAPPVTGFAENNSSNMTPATPARPESPGAGIGDAGSAVQPPPTIGRPTPPIAGTNETAAGSMVPAIAAPASPAPTGASPPNSVAFEKAAGSTGAVTSPAVPSTPVFTAPKSPETLAPEVRSAPSVRIESADPWHGGGGNVAAAVGLAPPMAAGGIIVQAPAAGPPPLVKPVAPGGPKAQSYLVEEYRLQTGDNFEKLSQKFYFSPKYSAALQRYNQNEPLAAPGLRANPPMLSVGQVVWMPPARILERDYGEMIPGLQPIPADRGAPGMTTAVRPVAPTGPVLYKVRARGESLWEIARHTLNDSNQWAQILNLNRNLKQQPEIPIAPGTILRLPPEAKIDATDRP
jgi:LysM domain